MSYQFVGEDEHTFRVKHPDGTDFTIAKAAVGEGVHKKIKALKMYDGGEVPKERDASDSDGFEGKDESEWGKGLRNWLGVDKPVEQTTPSETPATEIPAPTMWEPPAMATPTEATPQTIAQAPLQQPMTPEPAPIAQPAPPMGPMGPLNAPNQAPAPQMQTAQSLDQGLSQSKSDIYTKQQEAIKSGSAIQQNAFQQQAKDYAKLAQDQAAVDAETQKKIAPLEAQNQQLNKAISDGKIDHNRLYSNMGTGNKILAAISIALSGIGSGMTGKENMAMSVIQKNIDRDIDEQKAELGKKQTLFSENLRMLGDVKSAALATKAQMASAVQSKVASYAAQSNSAQINTNSQIMLSQIDLERQKLNREVGLRQLAAQGGNVDPAVLVPHLVPEHQQKAVFDEIQRAQDTRRMGDTILKSFDQAAKENTILRTGGGYLRTPASVLALHQSMQPTFKDLEGTVRQAAMDNTFKNITPAPGDADGTIKDKRAALEDYLKSKAAAPTAKGFGINLDKFGSTTTQRAAQPVERQAKNGQVALFDPNTKQFLGYKK